MKIELKNVKFSESLSDETNAFTADLWVDGKKCGYCRNDGCGGCTNVSPTWSPDLLMIFRECETHLKTQPQLNIGSNEKPFMVDCNLESMVDHLFESWLKKKEETKMKKFDLTHVRWGVPKGLSYTHVNFKKPISTIPHNVLQGYLDTWKLTFKTGEQFLNTNLEGFNL